MKNYYAVCYNTLYIFKTKEDAISDFKECCDYCDPMSSEYSRYASIIVDLQFSNIGYGGLSDYITEIYDYETKERKQLSERKKYMDVIAEIESEEK